MQEIGQWESGLQSVCSADWMRLQCLCGENVGGCAGSSYNKLGTDFRCTLAGIRWNSDAASLIWFDAHLTMRFLQAILSLLWDLPNSYIIDTTPMAWTLSVSKSAKVFFAIEKNNCCVITCLPWCNLLYHVVHFIKLSIIIVLPIAWHPSYVVR